MYWLWKHCLVDFLTKELSDVYTQEINLPMLIGTAELSLVQLYCTAEPSTSYCTADTAQTSE
jgi:hypothetical protein